MLMKRKSLIAAAALIASGVVVGTAFAQTTTPPLTPAQRLQNLKAKQDAAVAAAKARQNTIQRPVPTATTTATATPTATTTAAPTATATATAAPTTTPTATATASASASAKPATSAVPAASGSAVPKAPPAPLSLDIEELKKTRPDRRKAEFAALQARWGELLRDPRANTELKLHAQRTAYLQRIRALASKANDAKTVQAVDILITKEDTRDADAMNALRSGALPAVAAGAAK
jgi:hypothetical protein